MNDNIAGSPLKRLTWNRLTGEVTIDFRDGTDRYDRKDFLRDLWISAKGAFYNTIHEKD